MCTSCRQILEPQQPQLVQEVAAHTLANPVDLKSDIRYWNLPFTSSLSADIRSAVYSMYNLFHLYLLRDDALSMSLLRNARGLVFLTAMKGGFMIAPKFGTGLIICRLANGRQVFSPPASLSVMDSPCACVCAQMVCSVRYWMCR